MYSEGNTYRGRYCEGNIFKAKISKFKALEENGCIDKPCRCSTAKGKACYGKPCKVNACNGRACKDKVCNGNGCNGMTSKRNSCLGRHVRARHNRTRKIHARQRH
jgi:hypothetical protein